MKPASVDNVAFGGRHAVRLLRGVAGIAVFMALAIPGLRWIAEARVLAATAVRPELAELAFRCGGVGLLASAQVAAVGHVLGALFPPGRVERIVALLGVGLAVAAGVSAAVLGLSAR